MMPPQIRSARVVEFIGHLPLAALARTVLTATPIRVFLAHRTPRAWHLMLVAPPANLAVVAWLITHSLISSSVGSAATSSAARARIRQPSVRIWARCFLFRSAMCCSNSAAVIVAIVFIFIVLLLVLESDYYCTAAMNYHRAVHVCITQDRPGEIGPAEIGLAEIGLAEIGPAEIGLLPCRVVSQPLAMFCADGL